MHTIADDTIAAAEPVVIFFHSFSNDDALFLSRRAERRVGLVGVLVCIAIRASVKVVSLFVLFKLVVFFGSHTVDYIVFVHIICHALQLINTIVVETWR